MAVTYESIATANGESTSITVAKPANLAAGDVMVFVAAFDNSGGDITATGWTAIADVGPHSADTNRMVMYYKVATSGDASASDFTITNTNEHVWVAAIIRLSDCAVNFVDDDATNTNSTTPSYSTGITPPAASSLWIMAISTGAAGTTASAYAIATSSPTWTERAELSAAGDGITLHIATATRTEATASGNWSATLSGSVESNSIITAVSTAINGAATPAVVTFNAAVQAPTPSGSATVTTTVISMTSSVQAPTATGGTAKFTNTDKSTVSTFTNTNKS